MIGANEEGEAVDLGSTSPTDGADESSALVEGEADASCSTSTRRARSQSRVVNEEVPVTPDHAQKGAAGKTSQQVKKLRLELITACEQLTVCEKKYAEKCNTFDKEHAHLVQMEVLLANKDAEIETLDAELSAAKAGVGNLNSVSRGLAGKVSHLESALAQRAERIVQLEQELSTKSSSHEHEVSQMRVQLDSVAAATFLVKIQSEKNWSHWLSTMEREHVARERVNLIATIHDKEVLKALGARWDGRVWYVPTGKHLMPFAKWLPLD